MPDNDSNVRDLEQLVDQLQTVNRTLSSTYDRTNERELMFMFPCFLAIDASLNDPTSDEPLL